MKFTLCKQKLKKILSKVLQHMLQPNNTQALPKQAWLY